MAKKRTTKAVPQQVNEQKINNNKQEPAKAISVNWKLVVLLGIISCIVYANTLKNGFALDDYTVIKDNTIVTKGISAIPEILSTPYRKGYFVTSNDLYRPLSLVMFAVEYQFFGLNPIPNHLMNVLLFAGCVVLLFLFLNKLPEKNATAIAFVAALLFALHPIHTEVVANIKSRDELLCFFFAFLSLNVFVKYIHTAKRNQLILGAVCFFLSLLSKETVITFVAVIPLIFFFIKNENKKQSAYVIGISVLVAIIFLIVRTSVLNYHHANESVNVSFIDNALAKADLSFESRVATAVLILGYYLKLLFIPYPLISDYSYNSVPFSHFSDPLVLISLAAYIFLAVFSIKRFVKNNKDPYAFGILFFLITISLFSNIPFLIGTTMGERLLFFPSVGFCLVFALLIVKLAIKPAEEQLIFYKNPKILGIIIPVCLAYGVIAINRNSEWLDNYTLYEADVKKSPENCKLNFFVEEEMEKNMAANEKDPVKLKQIRDAGIIFLRKAISIYPDYADAHANLAFSFYTNSQYDSAEVHDERALALKPVNPIAMTTLAKVYFYKKKYAPAIASYRNVAQYYPGDVSNYANMGVCFFYLGKFDSAIYYSNKAISVDPAYKATYETLAFAYKMTGNMDSATKYAAIANKNNPAFKL